MAKDQVTVCSVFGHIYNDAGICNDCGNDDLLKDMKET